MRDRNDMHCTEVAHTHLRYWVVKIKSDIHDKVADSISFLTLEVSVFFLILYTPLLAILGYKCFLHTLFSRKFECKIPEASRYFSKVSQKIIPLSHKIVPLVQKRTSNLKSAQDQIFQEFFMGQRSVFRDTR